MENKAAMSQGKGGNATSLKEMRETINALPQFQELKGKVGSFDFANTSFHYISPWHKNACLNLKENELQKLLVLNK